MSISTKNTDPADREFADVVYDSQPEKEEKAAETPQPAPAEAEKPAGAPTETEKPATESPGHN